MEERVEVALAEFRTLRDEMLAIRQLQTAVYTAALTILAAVGSVALAKKGGRVEILLVLPYVLCGLGLVTVQCTVGVIRIGDYVRDCLWPRLSEGKPRATSWERFTKERSHWSSRVVTALVPSVILLVPSIAAIAITHHEMSGNLAPLWWGAVGVVVVSVGASIVMSIAAKRKPREEHR